MNSHLGYTLRLTYDHLTMPSKPANGCALRDAVHEFVRALGLLTPNKRPGGQNLQVSEAHALIELHRRDKNDRPTLRELGERLHIDKSNVSRLCARLEAAGLILSAPCEEDRRSKRLRLTAKGKRLANSVDVFSAERFSAVIAALPNHGEAAMEGLVALTSAIRDLGEV